MSDLKRKCEQYEQYNKLQNPPFISRGIFLIKRFFYEAIFIPKGMETPPREIINTPELRIYLSWDSE